MSHGRTAGSVFECGHPIGRGGTHRSCREPVMVLSDAENAPVASSRLAAGARGLNFRFADRLEKEVPLLS